MQSKELKRKATFRVRPKSIPVLTNDQFKVVVREMNKAPTQADFDRMERVKKILKQSFP